MNKELEREITERNRAEEALAQRAEELVRSNAKLEQFASVASHDLREPLRKITNYTELLGHHYEGQLDEKADKYISYIVGGATRVQTLIAGPLTYSRVGRADITFKPIEQMLNRS